MTTKKTKAEKNPLAPPAHLNQVAQNEWKTICKSLETVDLLNVADRSALELYCQTFSGWRHACEMVAQQGAVIQVTTSGGTFAKRNPYDIIRERNAAQCARLLRDFGLTPTSKNRSEDPDQEKETVEQTRERLVRLFGT